ncbi:hypothetical protein EH240_32210 [Mesorhizobium tamadayense]|uniref:Uncharacterized protein n=1 Tax=Mesorhizobium tamadayense TaxID=425306 RepID=A0A3P3F0R8_9HYPH|nr:hypothetical protein [Mesorhizobium tamadayense]RRH91088.1 hypothetical protein EH240_32210 [Mesorhizobium tamadayense]
MNIDPRNTPQASIALRQSAPRQPGDMRAQTSSPAHSSTDQAKFEQQLSELTLTHQRASIETEGNKRARAIQGSERCPAPSFVNARAQLAATLTGATVEALGNDIGQAAHRAAQWPTAIRSSAGSVDSSGILNDVLASSYVKLHRFQNEATDCRTRGSNQASATSHLRDMALFRSRGGLLWDHYQPALARKAAKHMLSETRSPFLSLVENPSQLAASPDLSAKAIAENARELHTYTVPRATAWPPKRIDDALECGNEAEDPNLQAWVRRLPTQETEVLFLGGNLDEYRTASEPNPYRTGQSRE